MKFVTITHHKQSLLHFDDFPLESISFEAIPLGSGGFGQVYKVLYLNHQAPKIPQVVKIFFENNLYLAQRNFKSIQRLQDQILLSHTTRKENKQTPLKDIPLLYALPQASFEGVMDNKRVYGYVMNGLDATQFTAFDTLMEDSEAVRQYYQLPFQQKLSYATQLVEGLEALQSLQFIHADLNPDNLFLALHQPQLVLIDYDSGVVLQSPKDKPTTWGKPNDWVAPEIMFALARQQQEKRPTIAVNLYSDLWSTSIGLHYLLYLCHPFFFFESLSERNMQQYFEQHQWYQSSPQHQAFNTTLTEMYQKYVFLLEKYTPEPLLALFKQSFNAGFFNPEQRLTYQKWYQLLGNLQEPYTFVSLPLPKSPEKTDYTPTKVPRVRPKPKKNTQSYTPQRLYTLHTRKQPRLRLSYISSYQGGNLPSLSQLTTPHVIKLVLIYVGIFIVVLGGISIWQRYAKNVYLEKLKHVKPITYTPQQLSSSQVQNELKSYQKYEQLDSTFSEMLKQSNTPKKVLEQQWEKNQVIISDLQERDDSLFKSLLKHKQNPDSLYTSYSKWLRSYEIMMAYRKKHEQLSRTLHKPSYLIQNTVKKPQ